MRLVNIESQGLEEFFGIDIPPYATLSHRWGSITEELNFKEVFKLRTDEKKRGFRKLIGACRMAAEYDVRYLWIDTCCIDKSSSAELSEAINSMFTIYKDSRICLAYFEGSFSSSQWFQRCWTLQELLAPKYVDFFDRDWRKIGSRHSRHDEIMEITKIDSPVLQAENHFWIHETPVASKMCWASSRNATRLEDAAYCLMGIFDIYMPLLYGEGERAFTRLQEEIIRTTRDPSIFHWRPGEHQTNMLAERPADFAQGLVGNRTSSYSNSNFFSLTNLGIEVDGTLVKYGLEYYGIQIGIDEWQSITLLVSEEPSSGYYVKVGVIKTGRHDLWVRTKKLTIWRDRHVEKRSRSLRLSIPESVWTGTSFVLHVKPELPITVVKTQAARVFNAHAQFIDVAMNEGNQVLTPWYSLDVLEREVLRTCWRLDETHVLWVDFSINFSSRACMWIRRYSHEDQEPSRENSYLEYLTESYGESKMQDATDLVSRKTLEYFPGVASSYFLCLCLNLSFPPAVLMLPKDLTPSMLTYYLHLRKLGKFIEKRTCWQLEVYTSEE